MSSRRSLKPKLAVEAWLRRGVLDIFVAFELEQLVNYRLFCLHQAVEKLCKAYLIGSQAPNYETLNADKAGSWIDNFTKSLGHDLSYLLGHVSIGIGALTGFLQDVPFIELLNKGYTVTFPHSLGHRQVECLGGLVV